MIDVNDQYETLVGARLLDFFGSRTPWHRGLWTIGIVLTLKELLGVSEAVRSSILFQNSVEDLSRAAMALAGKDPGVGGKARHDALQRSLRTDLRFLGMDYRVFNNSWRRSKRNTLRVGHPLFELTIEPNQKGLRAPSRATFWTRVLVNIFSIAGGPSNCGTKTESDRLLTLWKTRTQSL